MSQENVEALRRGYEALNRRDIDTWLEGFHADADMHDLPSIPDAPVRRGHAAIREWLSMMDELWVDARYEPQEFTDTGQFVVVAVRAKARGRGSDIPMDVGMFHVFEIEDGKIRRALAYLDRDEAFEAVGLRE